MMRTFISSSLVGSYLLAYEPSACAVGEAGQIGVTNTFNLLSEAGTQSSFFLIRVGRI